MPYQAIEKYGIIGNMKTAALICETGSIDWMCYPHFNSPSVFAAILDDEKGGRFAIHPVEEDYGVKQLYWHDTNVIITRFVTEEGACELIDYMPVGDSDIAKQHNCLIRRIRMMRGKMKMKVLCQPAFDYARAEHKAKKKKDGIYFSSDDLELVLHANIDLKLKDNVVDGTIELEEKEEVFLVLKQAEKGADISEEKEQEAFDKTIRYWRSWLSKCTYEGRWREMIYRSALVLKLLTFEETGAIVAAPTCSLPEAIGGERNWDYRYTWIRDAAFTVYALMRLGFTEEATDFMRFIEKRVKERKEGEPLQIMFGINDDYDLEEETLDHLEGYKQSSPVRIGNGAYKQFQLDIYGELMDSVYLLNKYGTPVSYEFWTELRALINWNADNWDRKDAGIWEVRGGDQHFVFSKLMSWVALDRGIRLADKRSFPADREKWLKVRDEIYEDIQKNGWNEEVEAFVQHYDTDALDASVLLMPLVFFMSPSDPRMLKTLDAINRPPDEGGLITNDLVYRYDISESPDGLDGEEGTFNICTFWMVEALTRAGKYDEKYMDEARLMFEHMLSYANHLGLFAEETGKLGAALGNYPQAFTHLALISAAFNLDRTLG